MINPESKRILIVDDDPGILKYLSRSLDRGGYTVEIAETGLAALESFNQTPPSLILLDIRIPGIDGYEFCKIIRSSPAGESVPIIFISGLQEENDKLKSFACGGVDYLTKPFNLKEVRARIKLHLSLQEKIDELALFNRAMLDREGKIIELKEEVNALCRESGKKIRYPEIWKEEE